jgi:hypothetical protein
MPQRNSAHPRGRKPDDFALAPHQLAAAHDPAAPIRTVVEASNSPFAGRPYSVWRDDPEIARRINESLAAPGE